MYENVAVNIIYLGFACLIKALDLLLRSIPFFDGHNGVSKI